VIRQWFALASVVLYFGFLLWKAAAAVMGWSWR